MHIYQLPYQERRELCRILDQSDKWERLGGEYMEFDFMTIQEIRRGRSPTEELLTLWGHQNHTVFELFILLRKMEHFQAMIVLKKFVDSKYHKWIREGEDNITNALYKFQIRNKNEPCTKDLGIAEHNFENSKKVLNAPVADNHMQNANANGLRNNNLVSNENNESIENNAQKEASSKNSKLVNLASVPQSAGAIPQILYQELEVATNNWDPKTILGKGGFGIVFKGTWKFTEVAIKRIEQRENTPESNNIQLRQSITELHCLNAYRHDNILPLYGYSINGPQPCLVYQYMTGGCLEQRLRSRVQEKQLNWTKRFKIAKGTARGLQFLHTIGDKPLIHGDIKSANILLDQNDDAKIGDFGLAREGPHSDYTHMKISRIHGTRPYLPDEFLRSRNISIKVDTYSYGVVLFEIATGLSAYSENRPNKFLRDHVLHFEGDIQSLKDLRPGSENDRFFMDFIKIGKICVSKSAKDRPDMRTVLIQFESIQ